MLTRIAYQEIGMIDQLPPLLDEDNIQFYHKPYRHKVKPDKADKFKRESREFAITCSQGKKMQGQLSGSNNEEDKEEDKDEDHKDAHSKQ